MNDLKDTIDSIKNTKNVIDDAIKNSDDVKNKESTLEDEKKEPGYILYEGISETCIKLLEDPEVVNIAKKLYESIGEELGKSLIELLIISMVNSSYQSILLYDNLLKEELISQFDNYGNYLNNTTALVNSHDSVLQVFQKRISDIENKLKIYEFKNQ